MNILQDKDLRFHGICQNIIKYISILENGILTQKDSSKADGYVRNYNGCNEKQNISDTCIILNFDNIALVL